MVRLGQVPVMQERSCILSFDVGLCIQEVGGYGVGRHSDSRGRMDKPTSGVDILIYEVVISDILKLSGQGFEL
jgi:hypothetical protein